MVSAVAQELRRKAEDRALRWADAMSRRAATLHRNAPRGGESTNKYGQPRSAPGEVPATEDRDLLDLIELGVNPVPGGGEATVNYARLEFGAENLEPRPLGTITLLEVMVAAKGSGPEGVS
jgi:hypothetical protein